MQNPEGSADFNRRKRFLLLGHACAATSVECIFLRARAAVQLWNFLLLCFLAKVLAPLRLLHRRHRGTNRHFQLTRLLNPPPYRRIGFGTCSHQPSNAVHYRGATQVMVRCLSGASSKSEVNYILGPWMAQMLHLQALLSASTCTLRRLSRQ